jgi:putative transposase
MPRIPRASKGGYCYHVLNRGNAGKAVFRKAADFEAFLNLLAEAGERMPMRLLSFCLMPNHFHLALWPIHDGDLSKYMMWLMTAHVRRYHQYHQSSGHVWQGRFRAHPIQKDSHLLTVMRYIESNPLRVGRVQLAENWEWSSLAASSPEGPKLHPGPVERPPRWRQWVNKPQSEDEVEAIRECIRRGRPFGAESWQVRTAKRLGLESSLRPRGRPRKWPIAPAGHRGDDQ